MKIYLSIILFVVTSARYQAFAIENFNKNWNDSTTIRNLKIGEEVPDFIMGRVFNDSTRIARTSDFKDKLLIIDFWATNCGSCIEALPRLDSLRKTFGTLIKILPVTYESEKAIKAFYKNSKIGRKINLPTIVEDTVLGKWFNHKTVGHQVWIYKNKIIAITQEEYVDERNIKSILAGKKIYLPIKDDFIVFEEKKAILSIDKKFPYTTKPLEYSALFGNISNVDPKRGMIKDSIHKTIRIYCISSPIISAYLYYWGIIDPSLIRKQPNQVILEVKDHSKYIYNHYGYYNDWLNKNSISYESVINDTGQSRIKIAKLVISDLDRLLKLKGRWEKRNINCLSLVRTTNQDKIKTRGKEKVIELEKPIKVFKNASLSNDLVWQLNQYHDNPQVFDETNYTNKVDLNLDVKSWTDITSIKKALQPYGLDLIEEKRLLNVFILTEL